MVIKKVAKRSATPLRALVKATANEKAVGCQDAQSFMEDMKPFFDHLLQTKSALTAKYYGHALQKLARMHGESGSGMSSPEYLVKVRQSNLPGMYAAAVVSLCKFRGAEGSKQSSGEASESRKPNVPRVHGKEHVHDSVESSNWEKPVRSAKVYERSTVEAAEARKPKVPGVDGKGSASDNVESFEQDLQPFLDYLNRERPPLTAKAYGGALQKLASMHRKSLRGMASQGYLDKVRTLKLPRKFAASLASLLTFQGGEASEKSTVEASESCKRKVPSVDGKENASDNAESFERDLQPFLDHLNLERAPPTAKAYESCIRRLERMHRKSLSGMASQGYLDKVRTLKLPNQFAASVVSLLKFQGAEASEKSTVEASESRRPKVPRVDGKKNACDNMESFKQDLQPFLDHLSRGNSASTAKVYGTSLRKLARMHRKSLSGMASQEYLDKVRKSKLPGQFASSVASLLKFRGAEVSERSSESRKRKLPSVDGKENASDNVESLEQDLQPFLDHLNREKSPLTAKAYGISLRKLARMHRKSLSGMASQVYLDKVRKLKFPRMFAASVASLLKFQGDEASEKSTVEASESRKPKVSSLDRNGNASDNAESFEQDLQLFLDHLNRERSPLTAKAYGWALRKLARMHRKSLSGMASQEYLDKVRKLNLRGTFASSVASLCKFRGAEVSEQGIVEASESRKRKWSCVVAKEHAGEKKARDQGLHGLQAFLDHLQGEMGEATAKQYGQGVRKLARVHQKSLDDMLSQEYLDHVRSLKWNAKYQAAVRALCKFRGMRIMCTQKEQKEAANAEAQKRLAVARANSRPVSDSDVLEVFRLLPFAQNTARRNVMPKDTEWVHSTTLGVIGDYRGNAVVSNATTGYEDVVRLLCQWVESQMGGAEPFFPITSININKGYAAARHRDRSNLGPSAIRALGDCRGGLLRYWPNAAPDEKVEELRDEDSVVLDPKHRVVIFDGNFPHAVTPFEGERYSVVFFTTTKYTKASPKCLAHAKQMGGLRWPTAKLLATAKAKVAEP